MNYPIWDTPLMGGPSWIALISIFHVYIAHLAVGGGFFIWQVERLSRREKSMELRELLHRFTWFFLYLTMVFGGVTGVGIWFIIGLVSPEATSILIHNFVFAWATEWVFFIGEIVALLLFAYRFYDLDERTSKTLAFLYALFAWLSLFVINGILSFMLTPGRWLETKAFMDGFLNPGFWYSLALRTGIAVTIAGLFGLATGLVSGRNNIKVIFLKNCVFWIIAGLFSSLICSLLYFGKVNDVISGNWNFYFDKVRPFVILFFWLALVLFVLTIVSIFSVKRWLINRIIGVLIVLFGLIWIGVFEYAREVARKPYVINGYLYSNSIFTQEVKDPDSSILDRARWSAYREEDILSLSTNDPGNLATKAKIGRVIFEIQCLACHTRFGTKANFQDADRIRKDYGQLSKVIELVKGDRYDIIRRVKMFSFEGLRAQLNGQGKLLQYMPPVIGSDVEKDALAVYLASLAGIEISDQKPDNKLKSVSTPEPERMSTNAEYVLLVWNDLGMHCVSDNDDYFVILPPGNTLEAQLIKRGVPPEIVGDRFELTYSVEPGFEEPARHVKFWDNVSKTFQKSLPRNVGLTGNGLRGKFIFDKASQLFRADMIPVVPYNDNGDYNPYPLFTIRAISESSNKEIASVSVVAPVSTEMGCKKCHGGQWRVNGIVGISDDTSKNLLYVHDRINGTRLLKDALSGRPRLCQDCHADPALNKSGEAGRLSLSSAMHGWHANYIHDRTGTACGYCHPVSSTGATRCSRGIHANLLLSCVNCHGTMSDHAISLLKGESNAVAAARLMKGLKPVVANSIAEINGRRPWVNEPDCLSCHIDFGKPTNNLSAFNKWTDNVDNLYRRRTDMVGIRCIACHGSPHAEYPAINPYSKIRDVLQPLQYSGQPYPIGSEMSCEICHVEKMEFPIHHENMARPFRNKSVWK